MSFFVTSDHQDRISNTSNTNVSSNDDFSSPTPPPTHPSLTSLFQEKVPHLEEKTMSPRTFSFSSLQDKTPLSSTPKSKSFPDNPLPFLQSTEDRPLEPQANEKSDLPPPLSPTSNNQNTPDKKKTLISPPGSVRKRPIREPRGYYFFADARFPF